MKKENTTSESVNKALSLYMKKSYKTDGDYVSEDVDYSFFPELKKDSRGKPYFSNCSLKLSVSHTENVWVCAFSPYTVGIDIESETRHINNYQQLAKRFFTDEEYRYIEKSGKDAFFKIWTRKEAYLKYDGTGIAGGLDSFSTVKNDILLNTVNGRAVGTVFHVPGYMISYCTAFKCKIEINNLL